MAAAGPVPSEFQPDRVEPGLYGKPTTPSFGKQRSSCNSIREWALKYQLTLVVWVYNVALMAHKNVR